MKTEIGHIEALFRYPVKSMGGEPLETTKVGWHGFEGDRRLALRRMQDQSGFPWLTATKLPDLLRYAPVRWEGDPEGALPSHIRTPDGVALPVMGEELSAEVSRRYGAPLQMMQLNHGIFDEAPISIISTETIAEIGRVAGINLDIRRFRPNILVRVTNPVPFQEDAWVGSVLTFGDKDDTPEIAVTLRDIRCPMVNFDPETLAASPEVLKTVVRTNQTTAGVYGTVTQIGRLKVGQAIFLR